MSKRNNVKNAAFVCVVLILVLVMIISGLRILESTVFFRGQYQQETIDRKTITRNGVDYYPRRDVTVMLVMGIDQMGPVKNSESYTNYGAADMVMLLIFDEKNEVCNILYLNRDTMMEMPVLGIGGKQAGTYYGQLALSHTYGSGLEDSCENVRTAVSDFLNGITIDHYIAMNMDAISILNDAVGGVTVTVKDDFSMIDDGITMGEYTLRGEQAIDFVRTRKDVGDQLNLSRIERQKEYVENFVAALRAKIEAESEFLLAAYEDVAPYLVSDCSMNTVGGMIDRYEDYELNEIVTPAGDNVLGNQYYEFYVDEQELDALILRLFYVEKS